MVSNTPTGILSVQNKVFWRVWAVALCLQAPGKFGLCLGGHMVRFQCENLLR